MYAGKQSACASHSLSSFEVKCQAQPYLQAVISDVLRSRRPLWKAAGGELGSLFSFTGYQSVRTDRQCRLALPVAKAPAKSSFSQAAVVPVCVQAKFTSSQFSLSFYTLLWVHFTILNVARVLMKILIARTPRNLYDISNNMVNKVLN